MGLTSTSITASGVRRGSLSARRLGVVLVLVVAPVLVGHGADRAAACQVIVPTFFTAEQLADDSWSDGLRADNLAGTLHGVLRVRYEAGADAQNGRTRSSIAVVERYWGALPQPDLAEPELIGGHREHACGATSGPDPGTVRHVVITTPGLRATLVVGFESDQYSGDRPIDGELDDEAEMVLTDHFGPATPVSADTSAIDSLRREATNRASGTPGPGAVVMLVLATAVVGVLWHRRLWNA